MSSRFEPGASAEGYIPLCVPYIEPHAREWDYLRECVETNFVSSVGPFVTRFEKELARYVGAKHAVATTSGTAALHVALIAAGIGADDEVFVPTLTFIAPANAVRYVGAWPVFIDADPNHWALDVDKLRDFIERECSWSDGVLRNRRSGRVIKALLPVHVLGHPVDMDAILALAERYNLLVLEDATESLGATYRNTPTGTIGRIGCYSFNGNKLITTGGGGMVVTDDDALAAKVRYLTTQAKDDPLEYIHGAVGFNYRLTNVQAALGCAQLEQIDAFLAAKKRIAERYVEAFASIPGIDIQHEAAWAKSANWMFTITLDANVTGCDSRTLMRELDARRIQARPLWQPLHVSPAHVGAVAGDCTVAERLNRDAISLPSSVGLTAEDQERVIAAVQAVIEKVPSAV